MQTILNIRVICKALLGTAHLRHRLLEALLAIGRVALEIHAVRLESGPLLLSLATIALLVSVKDAICDCGRSGALIYRRLSELQELRERDR